MRLTGSSLRAPAIAFAILVYIASAVFAFRGGPSTEQNLPPFSVMTPAEYSQVESTLDDTTIVVYRPIAFDPLRQTLTVRIFFRPGGSSGGIAIGDNWSLTGSDVRLVFDGPLEVAGRRGDPVVIFTGNPEALPSGLLDELRRSSAGIAAVDELLDGREPTWETLYDQYSPFEVELPTQLYGRSFSFRDDAFWFPFDSYGFQLSIQGNTRYHFSIEPLAFLEEPGPWYPLAMEPFPGRGNEIGATTWSTFVEGWEVAYRHTAWLSTGFPTPPDKLSESMKLGLIGVAFHVERPLSEKLLTALFALIYLVTMLALVIVVLSVRRGRRPPTGFGLVWAAALAFAAVSLRTALPGEVPYGVAFDWVFFFPTLLGSALFTLMLATDWVRRDDFTP